MMRNEKKQWAARACAVFLAPCPSCISREHSGTGHSKGNRLQTSLCDRVTTSRSYTEIVRSSAPQSNPTHGSRPGSVVTNSSVSPISSSRAAIAAARAMAL